MIARFGLLTRDTSHSAESFIAHWRESHAALAAGFPGLRAYLQHRLLSQTTVIGPAIGPLDGVSELHFDDLPAMNTAVTSSAFAGVSQDEHGFLDDVRLLICARYPRPNLDPIIPGRSAILLLNTAQGRDAEDEALVQDLRELPGLRACDDNPVVAHDGRNLSTVRDHSLRPNAVIVLRFGPQGQADLGSITALVVRRQQAFSQCHLCEADSIRIV